MSKGRSSVDYASPIRRLLVGALVLSLLALFLFWRIDGPRAEQFRAAVVDRVVPSMEWAMGPVARVAGMIENWESYTRIYAQNQELRRELQQMKAWKEAALQLEQENAKLLDLNKVRLDPELTYITGVVLADAGSPFRQSVLLNVGGRDGIRDGWATTDGLGLVGRISGVGRTSSRVILLTDAHSRARLPRRAARGRGGAGQRRAAARAPRGGLPPAGVPARPAQSRRQDARGAGRLDRAAAAGRPAADRHAQSSGAGRRGCRWLRR